MATKTRHSIVFDNGGALYLPPYADPINLVEPDLHETSTTKLYELGSRYVFNDKVFRYVRVCRTQMRMLQL